MKKYHGALLNKLMFPGALLHVLWHFLICKMFNIPINELEFFNFKMGTSYIIHERSDNKLFNLLVTIIPSFLNIILGYILIVLPSIELGVFKLYSVIIDGGFSWATPMDYIMMLFATWFGFSLIMNGDTSGKETYMIMATVYEDIDKKYPERNILGAPFIANPKLVGIIFSIVSFLIVPVIIRLFI